MHTNPFRALTGYMMVICAALLFGLNAYFSRLLFDQGISPTTLVEFRMLIGGTCLVLALLCWKRSALKLPKHNWGTIIAFGLSLAFVTYTYFVAISRLPFAIALVIQFSATSWMALGQALWLRRWPSPAISLSVVLTLGGVLLLTGLWQQQISGLDSIGLVFALLSLITYIIYLVIGRYAGRNLPALTSTTYGALVASLFWLIVQPPWSIPVSTWQPQHLMLIMLVGILGMAVPFSLMLAALRRLDATRVGLVGMLELVASSFIGYVLLGQTLTIWQILGCLLVLAGIVIISIEQLYRASRLPVAL
jgi:drug/metabolite transporter (DMT)-like permease